MVQSRTTGTNSSSRRITTTRAMRSSSRGFPTSRRHCPMLDVGAAIAMAVSRQHFAVRLTQAQRKVVAEIVPELSERLKLDERNQRTIPFTLRRGRLVGEILAPPGRCATRLLRWLRDHACRW